MHAAAHLGSIAREQVRLGDRLWVLGVRKRRRERRRPCVHSRSHAAHSTCATVVCARGLHEKRKKFCGCLGPLTRAARGVSGASWQPRRRTRGFGDVRWSSRGRPTCKQPPEEPPCRAGSRWQSNNGAGLALASRSTSLSVASRRKHAASSTASITSALRLHTILSVDVSTVRSAAGSERQKTTGLSRCLVLRCPCWPAVAFGARDRGSVRRGSGFSVPSTNGTLRLQQYVF